MKHKIPTLLFLLSIVHVIAFAQPTIGLQRDFGGSDDDGLACMALTKDAGYIVGGISSSNKSGNKTEDSRGGSDYWVLKLDSAGKIQWDKTIGGSDEDWLSSLQQQAMVVIFWVVNPGRINPAKKRKTEEEVLLLRITG
jgi:hypothetical protein